MLSLSAVKCLIELIVTSYRITSITSQPHDHARCLSILQDHDEHITLVT